MAFSPTGSDSRIKKYGTSYRIINLIVAFQVFTIVASRGDVYALGEAYAFGVIWSFAFKGLAMLVLRFKYKGERGWKVPVNFHIGKYEIPFGMASITMVLLATALINLFTNPSPPSAASRSPLMFFAIFTDSEFVNRKKHALSQQHMNDQFQLLQRDTVERESLRIRAGNVLVPVRDYNTLTHLRWALEKFDISDQDVVVMSARVGRFGAVAYDLVSRTDFQRLRADPFHARGRRR